MKFLILAFLITASIGCTSNPAIRVSDAEGIESISAIGMSCKKPFKLTKNCSLWSGPTKKISIDNVKMKVSSNEEGNITVMFSKNSATATPITNLAYELIKKELTKRGFKIIKVTPIESTGIMFGYAIQTDKPSYHIWDEFKLK